MNTSLVIRGHGRILSITRNRPRGDQWRVGWAWRRIGAGHVIFAGPLCIVYGRLEASPRKFKHAAEIRQAFKHWRSTRA